MKSGEWPTAGANRGDIWLVSELKSSMKCPRGSRISISRRQVARLDVFDLDDLPVIEQYLGRSIRHPFRLGLLDLQDRIKRAERAQEKLERLKECPKPKQLERSRRFFAKSKAMAKRGTPGKSEFTVGPWWKNRDGLWIEDED